MFIIILGLPLVSIHPCFRDGYYQNWLRGPNSFPDQIGSIIIPCQPRPNNDQPHCCRENARLPHHLDKRPETCYRWEESEHSATRRRRIVKKNCHG